jgi:large subunit ribosomal protein L17
MITLAKRGDAHARAQAKGFIYKPDLVDAIFEEAPARYAERQGGYCRVVAQVARRRGDNAEMAILELM